MGAAFRSVLLLAVVVLGCGSSRNGDAAHPPGPVRPPPDIVAPTPTAIDATCANAMTGPYEPEDSLKVPGTITVIEDDFTAKLQWASLDTSRDELGPNVEGYRVCWGTVEEGLVHGRLSREPVVQLFGVKNGVEHTAVVQSVDYLGRISAPSATVRFKGNPARVERLRQEMTGFFDDFNVKAGPLDELRWNSAFTGVDPTAGWSIVGDQQFASNYIGNATYLPGYTEAGGRGQTLVRPRGTFDFTGREGRIVFDMAGTFSDRVTWYIDVLPHETDADIIDMTGHATFDPGGGHPGRFLRFSQMQNIVRIHKHDAMGNPVNIAEVDVWNVSPDASLGRDKPMQQFELKVGKNRAAIYINGQLILENTDIALDYERSIVQWSIFGYNPAKIRQRWARLDFDNFGFDGPASNVVAHNYKTSFAFERFEIGDRQDKVWAVKIPDSLAGMQSARFFYTINQHLYQWDAADYFKINGETIPFPEPTSCCGSWQANTIAGDDQPFATNLLIPEGLLKGDGETNEVIINCGACALENLHIEAYFDAGSAPAYTQPAGFLTAPALPSFEPLGPIGSVTGVNDQEFPSEIAAGPVDELTHATPLSGTVIFNIAAETKHQQMGDGHNLGIAQVEILVDDVPYATVATDSSVAAPDIDDGPGVNYQWHKTRLDVEFDTTQLSNGPHVLHVRTYDSAGVFDPQPYREATKGVHITVAN